LPSGTIWATCNIGANSPEESGLYFAWGETQGYTAEQVGNEEGKRAFTWNDYEFGSDTALTKYNETDGKTILEETDDAATVNWGSNWKMPTKEQFEELIANTRENWRMSGEVKGIVLTSKVNGNTLFFPMVSNAFSGIIDKNPYYSSYNSDSLYDKNDNNTLNLNLLDSFCMVNKTLRYYGSPVRPVRK
jgi:hypothetical protein